MSKKKIGRPKQHTNPVRVLVVLDKKQHQGLRKLAAQGDTTVTDLLRRGADLVIAQEKFDHEFDQAQQAPALAVRNEVSA